MFWIKEAVKNLTCQYNSIDPFELASLKRIQVIPWNLHEDIQGFYKYDKRNKYIFINNNLDESHQKFVCAHEFGHSQLHPRVNTPFLRGNTLYSINKLEVEANTFAVELLLPDEAIYDLNNTSTTIYELASSYGIPKEVCHLKSITTNT
ncbi:ImmA/IrrE family metallo-endopeptidase [Desertibacillus haloalkaliphilus]|uniref:ImmA/IrrE family metallo-endopeptidase n=1 Tax=Desertibacillus haloalkaliphilus TaxID=1328930 RepID=UPI001C26AF23|nr:ImmA/IrrE family metallo-endopeptidase [Desertibacillus haloalkaliphilus]MBU8908553.1 ImmA/IrrE family metallo-endopeptidase [Desertibacillus haloalkaliphilus]